MSSPDPRPARARGLAIAAAVAAVTWLVFQPVLRNDFVDWDDPEVVVENTWIRGFDASRLRWMLETSHIGHHQPLTWLSFAVDFALFGPDPRAFHRTALWLHALNAALLFALIRALLLRSPRHARSPVALDTAAAAGALLFACHPLRVEPVAWVSDRGTLLCAAFVLLTLRGYVRAGAPPGDAPPEPAPLWTAASYFAALLAKGWAVGLPLVMLLLDALVLGRLRSRRDVGPLLIEKLPYLALAATFGLLALEAKAVSGALVGFAEHGLAARLLQACWGIAFYAWKTLAPVDLSPIYPLDTPPSAALAALAALAVATATAAALALVRRRPAAAAAWLASLILLVPVLGLAQAGPQLVADRYTYLATLPWAALLSAGLAPLLRAGPGRRAGVVSGLCACLLALSLLTAGQIGIWRSGEALWGRAVAVFPESAQVRFYFANTLARVGALEVALAEYDRALALGSREEIDVLNNRAAVLRRMGRPDLALRDLDAAIAIRPTARCLYNRGLLHEADDPDAAEADWTAAVGLDPAHADAHGARGRLAERRGDPAAALAHYRSALAVAGPGWAGRSAAEARVRALLAAAG